MAGVEKQTTIGQFQSFIREVYGVPNDRHFSLWDMLSNMERFTMRGLKGIRKNDYNKAKYNLLVSLSWFASILNRLHIDLEDAAWKRFPYMCSYCASCPCECREKGIKSRQDTKLDEGKRPASLEGFQDMFEKIYPSEQRTTEHAGIHLAEELGEFSEAVLGYMGEHREETFQELMLEAADIFSCMIGVFNSMKTSLSEELSMMFHNGCHVCHKSPCCCGFQSILAFDS